jgi:hypothetical protein
MYQETCVKKSVNLENIKDIRPPSGQKLDSFVSSPKLKSESSEDVEKIEVSVPSSWHVLPRMDSVLEGLDNFHQTTLCKPHRNDQDWFEKWMNSKICDPQFDFSYYNS